MSVRLDRPADAVARITIDRPDKMNAIDPATEAALRRLWAEVEQDAAVRCVILTGAGERSFCAGADIPTFLPELGRRLRENEDDGAFCGLTRTPPTAKPIIAAINGVAFRAGLVSRVCRDVDDLAATALALAHRIAANAPESVARTLAIVRRSTAVGLSDLLNDERVAFRDLIDTDEATRRIAAFQKRRPA